MRCLPRPLTCLLLGLLLLLTSQSMAVARGSAMATGSMVICTGDGLVTVYLDENGAPVEAPHPCPDCLILLCEEVTRPFVVLTLEGRTVAALPRSNAVTTSPRPHRYRPRAPPPT